MHFKVLSINNVCIYLKIDGASVKDLESTIIKFKFKFIYLYGALTWPQSIIKISKH